MLRFFGDTLKSFKDVTGDFLSALALYALISKVVFFIVNKDYFKSVGLSKYLKEDIDAIRNKHKHNDRKANEEITNLLLRNRYGMLGSAMLFLVEGLLVLLIGLVLKDALIYTHAASIDEFTVLNIPLTTAPIAALTAKEFSIGNAIAMFIFLIALSIQIWLDIRMENVRLVEQDKVDRVIWIIAAGMCALLPSGASVVMLCYKVMDVLLYVFYSKKKYQRLPNKEIK